jgi:hypothetical protein
VLHLVWSEEYIWIRQQGKNDRAQQNPRMEQAKLAQCLDILTQARILLQQATTGAIEAHTNAKDNVTQAERALAAAKEELKASEDRYFCEKYICADISEFVHTKINMFQVCIPKPPISTNSDARTHKI